VHEAVRATRTRELRNPILHYTYDDIAGFIAKINRYTTLEAENPAASAGSLRFFLAPLKEFVRRYVYRRGYLDGRLGLFVCFMHSAYIMIKLAKICEKRGWIDEDRAH
jgi:hypothetical protein